MAVGAFFGNAQDWRRCQQPIKAQAGNEWEAEDVGVNVSLSPAVAVPLPPPSSASFNHLRRVQKLCAGCLSSSITELGDLNPLQMDSVEVAEAPDGHSS